MNNITIYFIIINIIAFIFYGYDKYCSIKKLWRISEYHLLGLGLIGGGIGSLLGMLLFRHKTKKLIFKILVPIFILLNILVYIKISL